MSDYFLNEPSRFKPNRPLSDFIRPVRDLIPSAARRQLVLLPAVPQNASPVACLTSLYHSDSPGPYGDRRYPGNCGGNIIKDLLLYFQPKNVFDPMTGSGTCADVCRELQIPCLSKDIRDGFDATDAHCFDDLAGHAPFEFIWAHPPYWRQKRYTGRHGDLSAASSLNSFLEIYAAFIRNCAGVLAANGQLAILMGDYNDRPEGFIPLTYYTKHLAYTAGLKSHCTDIIRFSHGASSSRKSYRTKFIPGLHDVCMIFEKASGG